jgi:hypothetical protein
LCGGAVPDAEEMPQQMVSSRLDRKGRFGQREPLVRPTHRRHQIIRSELNKNEPNIAK